MQAMAWRCAYCRGRQPASGRQAPGNWFRLSFAVLAGAAHCVRGKSTADAAVRWFSQPVWEQTVLDRRRSTHADPVSRLSTASGYPVLCMGRRNFVIPAEPAFNVSAVPSKTMALELDFSREQSKAGQRRERPAMAFGKSCNLMGGQEIRPGRAGLVYPLRNRDRGGMACPGAGCVGSHDRFYS
jgi:hypothetical protein